MDPVIVAVGLAVCFFTGLWAGWFFGRLRGFHQGFKMCMDEWQRSYKEARAIEAAERGKDGGP